MTIKYKHLVDGTAFTAVEFNSRLGATVGGINNLSLEDTSLGAFRYNHLPCMIGPAGASEGDLTDSWETDYGGFTGAYSVPLHDKTEVRAITSVRAFGDGAGEDPDRIVSCNFKVGHTAGDVTGTFPSYVLDTTGHPGPNAVLLLGNINIKTWRLRGGTTRHGDLNEDAMAVEAAFRITYKKSDGTIEEKVLDKTRRQLSPRLTIGEMASYAPVPAGAKDVGTTALPILMETTTNFNNEGHVDEGVIRLFTSTAGSPVATDIQYVFPDLWDALTRPGSTLDDALVFYFDNTGPTSILYAPVPEGGGGVFGALVDLDATVAFYELTSANKNAIKIQPSELGTTREVLSWTDPNTTTWANVPITGPASGGWKVYNMETSRQGVPFIDDIDTNQDLPIRSVLLFSDLDIRGAEIIRIDLVATQVGALALPGRYNVFFTKANITAIPIQAGVYT